MLSPARSKDATVHRRLERPLMYQRVLLATTVGVVAILVVLHLIEPEYDPTWRMVSEYSNGQYGFVMRLGFLLTAIATAATAQMLNRVEGSRLAKAAALCFVVATVGLVMAALFNQDPVTSKTVTLAGRLHGVATIVGIPGFSIAALLAGVWLKRGGAGVIAVVIGLLPLLTFLTTLAYLFTGIPKDTGFAPGTYAGAFNRVVWAAMIGILLYLAIKVPKTTNAAF